MVARPGSSPPGSICSRSPYSGALQDTLIFRTPRASCSVYTRSASYNNAVIWNHILVPLSSKNASRTLNLPAPLYVFTKTLSSTQIGIELSKHAARCHNSMAIVTRPTLIDKWKSLWDKALDFGTKGTKVAQKLYHLCTKPLFGDRMCKNIITELSFIDHLTQPPILDGLEHDSSSVFSITANLLI